MLTDTIKLRLTERFDAPLPESYIRRIVFWHDEDHEFSDAIEAFPAPLATSPLNRLAAAVHLGSWRARAELEQLSEEQLRTDAPADVAASLGLTTDMLIDDMPPLDELSAGLEEMFR